MEITSHSVRQNNQRLVPDQRTSKLKGTNHSRKTRTLHPWRRKVTKEPPVPSKKIFPQIFKLQSQIPFKIPAHSFTLIFKALLFKTIKRFPSCRGQIIRRASGPTQKKQCDEPFEDLGKHLSKSVRAVSRLAEEGTLSATADGAQTKESAWWCADGQLSQVQQRGVDREETETECFSRAEEEQNWNWEEI